MVRCRTGKASVQSVLTLSTRRSLKTSQKKTYIDAVLCLQRHEAITKKQFADNDKLNPKNRFDDFHAVHNSQTPDVHFVGHFALWHRYMVAEYERTLRDVCGYKGAQP
jgi:tyrosinase